MPIFKLCRLQIMQIGPDDAYYLRRHETHDIKIPHIGSIIYEHDLNLRKSDGYYWGVIKLEPGEDGFYTSMHQVKTSPYCH